MCIFVPVNNTMKVVITDLQRGIEDISKYGAAYEKKRKQLQDEINRYNLSINREVFKKTKKEKEQVKKERLRFKNK